MPQARDAAQHARHALHRNKIMTGDPLMRLMECSRRTLQRRLRQWGCHTSFNHNGRYYALPDVVHFDAYGIWEYSGACFSRFGNLTQTVVGVIDEADQGLSASELAQRLHVNVHSFLSQFAARGLVGRDKVGATYRYVCADATRAAQQRASYLAADTGPPCLDDAAAVKLLLAWIEAPDATPTALSQTLQRQQVWAGPDAIARFLDQHGLGGKKVPRHSGHGGRNPVALPHAPGPGR